MRFNGDACAQQSIADVITCWFCMAMERRRRRTSQVLYSGQPVLSAIMQTLSLARVGWESRGKWLEGPERRLTWVACMVTLAPTGVDLEGLTPDNPRLRKASIRLVLGFVARQGCFANALEVDSVDSTTRPVPSFPRGHAY